MKKVVKGKTYNTGTAELIAKHGNNCSLADPSYFLEEVYRTKKGYWFMHYIYGPDSSFGWDYRDGENFIEGIEPMPEEKVKQWLLMLGEIETLNKFFSIPLLEQLWNIFKFLNTRYCGPLDTLVKPIVTYSVVKNKLIVSVNVNRDCFESGYKEIEEKWGKKFIDNYVCYEKTIVMFLKTPQDEKMAEYIFTLNYLPSTHWSIIGNLETALFEGFDRFNLLKEDWFEWKKRDWLAKPENITALRKKKIDYALAKIGMGESGKNIIAINCN